MSIGIISGATRFGPFCQNFLIIFLHTLKTSNSTADAASYHKWIFLFHIQSTVFKCLFCSYNRILCKIFHTSCGFFIHRNRRIKIFNLCSQMCFVIGCVKLRNWSDSNGSFFTFSQKSFTLFPIGVTAPIPVTTTRLLILSSIHFVTSQYRHRHTIPVR